MSAYRGSVPVWHTTCQSRCVSTTNRAPRCSGTRTSVVGIGEPVGALLHEDHEAVGVVGELDPRPDDPTVGLGVEAVVVVAVDLAQRVVVGLRLELDHAYPPEVGADRLDLGDDPRAVLRVRREAAALVGALVARLPEAPAVELAVGGGDRREVGVAAALPVHVLEAEVLRLGDRLGEVAQHHVAVLGQRADARVGCVERDVGGPVRACSASGR